MEPFKRKIEPGDDRVFERLVTGVSGQECVAWRKSFGRTGHLHFGPLRPKKHAGVRQVHRDRGKWVLHLWNTHVRLLLPSGETLSDSGTGDDAVLSRLSYLVGCRVSTLTFDSETLHLALTMSSGMVLELWPPDSAEPDDELWNLILPTDDELVLQADGTWSLEHSPVGGDR